MKDLRKHFNTIRNDLVSKVNNFTYYIEKRPSPIFDIPEPIRFEYSEIDLTHKVVEFLNDLEESSKILWIRECTGELYGKRNYDIISIQVQLLGLMQNNFFDIFSLIKFINYLLLNIADSKEKDDLIKKISKIFENKKVVHEEYGNKNNIYDYFSNATDELISKSKKFGYNVSHFDSKEALEFKEDYEGYLKDIYKLEIDIYNIKTHFLQHINNYLVTYSNAKDILLEINSLIKNNADQCLEETENFLHEYLFEYEK